METRKLYYENAFTREFDAAVVACEPRKDGFAVALDRTAFNPEGGGQTGDTGLLGGVRVLDTHERGGVIWHYTDAALAVGATVRGTLDWAERIRKMRPYLCKMCRCTAAAAKFCYYRNRKFTCGSASVVRLLKSQQIRGHRKGKER